MNGLFSVGHLGKRVRKTTQVHSTWKINKENQRNAYALAGGAPGGGGGGGGAAAPGAGGRARAGGGRGGGRRRRASVLGGLGIRPVGGRSGLEVMMIIFRLGLILMMCRGEVVR